MCFNETLFWFYESFFGIGLCDASVLCYHYSRSADVGVFWGFCSFLLLAAESGFYTLRSTLNTLRISKSIQHGIFSLLLPRSITNDEQKRRATLLEILMKKTLFYFREPKQSQRINYIVSHADCSALLCYQKKKYFG